MLNREINDFTLSLHLVYEGIYFCYHANAKINLFQIIISRGFCGYKNWSKLMTNIPLKKERCIG